MSFFILFCFCKTDRSDLRINGVYGDYRHNAVLLSHHNTRPNTRIRFDNIVIEQIHACKSTNPMGEDCFCYRDRNAIWKHPIIWIEQGIKAGSITLRDISRHEQAETKGTLIQIDQNDEIERLLADNIHQTVAPGVTAPVWQNQATVGHLIERNVER